MVVTDANDLKDEEVLLDLLDVMKGQDVDCLASKLSGYPRKPTCHVLHFFYI